MNLLNKILLSVFLLKCFLFSSIAETQAYSADHLILQDLDTQNNLATICQDDGSLCSDVEVVNFDDLDSDQKDQVIEMIASSPMDKSSYSSTLDLDKFSNFLSHSDEISYSSESCDSIACSFAETGAILSLGSVAVLAPSAVGSFFFKENILLRNMSNLSLFVGLVGASIFFVGFTIIVLED